MMKNLMIRAGIAVLGMVLTLTWWTIRRDNTHTQSANHIPTKVWAGGHTLEVEVETSCDAKMSVSFAQHDKPNEEQNRLETFEKISPGTHSWSIDVPEQVGGYVEMDAVAPHPGDTLTMKITVDGKVVDQQTEKLSSPLAAGYVFGVQRDYQDYSKASEEMVGEDGASSSQDK